MPPSSNSLKYLLLGLSALATWIQAPPSQAQTNAQQTIASCSACHGEDGSPKDSRFPVIWGQNSTYLQKQLMAYRSGQRDNQIMGSMAESVPKDLIPSLAQELSNHSWPTKSHEDMEIAKEPVVNSRASGPKSLGLCLSCHRTDPSTTADGTPRLWGQNLEYLLDQMSAFTQDDRTTNESMSAIMKTISKNEQNEIARFFSSH